jgi:metallo-beta-lactamase family protein
MAIRVTEVFKRYSELFDTEMKSLLRQRRSPFDFPGLTMVQTAEESKALNTEKGTSMIIAGSGMCTGGRIKHHLANHISQPENTILFVGYQAVGTLGRHILCGARAVRIHGRQHTIRAKIEQILGFSAHADRNEIIKWLSTLTANPKLVFITHGEKEAAEAFQKFLKEKTGFESTIPSYGEKISLE